MGRILAMAAMAAVAGLGSAGAMAEQAAVPCPPGAVQVRIAQSKSLAETEPFAGFSPMPGAKAALADPEQIEDDPYRAFIETVLRGLPDLLAATGQCAQAQPGPIVMDAVFTHVPVLGLAAEIPPDQRARIAGSNVTHRLASPWVIFERDEGANPPLRAVFIWNERQIFLDQAALAGAKIQAPFDVSPLLPDRKADSTFASVSSRAD